MPKLLNQDQDKKCLPQKARDQDFQACLALLWPIFKHNISSLNKEKGMGYTGVRKTTRPITYKKYYVRLISSMIITHAHLTQAAVV